MMLVLHLLVYSVAMARATYFMDDSNSSISYTAGLGHSWNTDPDNGSFNNTLTYISDCKTSDACQMRVPFEGSGITLYVAHGGDNVNASITLDGNSSSTTVTTILESGNPVETYNVSLYNVQSLPYGSHVITVLLLDLTGGIGSSCWFDYAMVNDTPSSPPALSPSPSATSSPSSVPQRPHKSFGAIIGGIAGGVSVIAVIIAATFGCRRRRKHVQMWDRDREDLFSESGEELNPQLALSYAAVPFPSAPSAENTPDPLSSVTSAPFTGSLKHLTPTRPDSPFIPTSSVTDPTPLVLSQFSDPSGKTISDNQLTDQQIDFVRDLGSANVPAEDIARVIKRMKDPQGSSVVGATSSDQEHPPSYDFHEQAGSDGNVIGANKAPGNSSIASWI